MIKSKYASLLPALFGAAALISGCASPEFIHKPFDPDKVGRIAVLPFLDGRQNPDKDTNFKTIATEATTFLMPEIKYKRKYLAFDTTDIGDVSEYSAHVIEPTKGQYPPPDYVKQLGPNRAKWVLVPVCDDLGRYNVVFYAGGSAKVSLYLFNKETGELWWKASIKQSQSMGGLLGGLADAMDRSGMETACLAQSELKAMETLPEVKNSVTKGGGDWIAQHYSIQSASDMRRIAVTSVVDGRRRESKKVDYEPQNIQFEILKKLHDKDYDGYAVQGFGGQQSVSQAQVALADATFGKSLAAVGAKYVLIPVADDVSNPPEFIGKHYELSFYLFNTETGELIWEGSSFGRSLGKALLALDKGDGLPRRKDLMK